MSFRVSLFKLVAGHIISEHVSPCYLDSYLNLSDICVVSLKSPYVLPCCDLKNAFIKVWFYDIHISIKSHQLFCLLSSYIGIDNKPNYYLTHCCFSCNDFKRGFAKINYDYALNVGKCNFLYNWRLCEPNMCDVIIVFYISPSHAVNPLKLTIL